MKPPYTPDDDEAADRYVGAALRSRDRETWKGLMSPAYVLQTERALRAVLDRVQVAYRHRQADYEELFDARNLGEIDHAEYQAGKDDWYEWRERTAHFESIALSYLRLVADLAMPLRGDEWRDGLMSTLAAVGRAIDGHRAASLLEGYEPTPHDRALWARLDLLRVQTDMDGGTLPLGELAKRQKVTTAAPLPESVFSGEPTPETGRFFAGLVLELSEGGTTVSRDRLNEVWRERARSVLSAEGEQSREPGSVSLRIVGIQLKHMEKGGMVERHGGEDGRTILITDRAKLEARAQAG